MKEKIGFPTGVALEKSGLTQHKFRKYAEELKISPVRYAGEISLFWTEEQINQIVEYSKLFIRPDLVINEIEMIEYYYRENVSVNQLSKQFNLSYHVVERIILRYKNSGYVYVNSKLRDYDG